MQKPRPAPSPKRTAPEAKINRNPTDFLSLAEEGQKKVRSQHVFTPPVYQTVYVKKIQPKAESANLAHADNACKRSPRRSRPASRKSPEAKRPPPVAAARKKNDKESNNIK